MHREGLPESALTPVSAHVYVTTTSGSAAQCSPVLQIVLMHKWNVDDAVRLIQKYSCRGILGIGA